MRGILFPNSLENTSVIGSFLSPKLVLFMISQQDKCSISIPSSIRCFETSILSSIVMPHEGYSGDILTAMTKSLGVSLLIPLMISIKNRDLLCSVPPQLSDLLFVFLPRNCVIRYPWAP